MATEAKSTYQGRPDLEGQIRRVFDHSLEHSPGVEPYALIFKRNFSDMRDSGSLTLKFVRNLRPENPRVHRKYDEPDFDFGFSQYAILNST
jgi:hypothetical protein